ncbi:MAG: glycosyltransferase, partial [Lachnospiraceae bacterium]|nr:glycosyltransferase [Lachnospiraceae bacterium]
EKIQKKSRVILNPIHAKYLDLPKPMQRKKEVVQSGRIVDFKNQAMLIEAFAEVHEKHPEYCLKLYGEDSGDGTWALLEQCIQRCNAKDYVFLMGGSNQLEKDLPDASVYAFSSDWEGLPNALMEAMAMGLPVVATDCPCGGPATLIEDGVNGLLIPIKNREKMTEGICRLIEDRQLAERLGEKAREIKDRANEEMICRQWEEYIRKLCR